MTIKNTRAAALKSAEAILDGAKAEGRELTPEEQSAIEGIVEQVKELDIQSQKLVDIFGVGASQESTEKHFGPGTGTKSLGALNHMTGRYESTVERTGRGYMDTSAKSFSGLANRAIRGMVGGSPTGAKALLPAGQTAVSVTMSPNIVTDAKPLSELLAALPVVTQSSPVFRWLQQTARTNAAAVVAAGAAKPTSAYGLTPVEGELKVIAHISEAIDKYVLGDVANLEQFITDELLHGLHLALEDQLLNGTGTGQLTGLLNTVGIQTQAFATDLLTTTRKSVTAVESIGHRAGLFVLSPTDWESLELARTTTAGSLELGGPVDRAKRTLWSVPVAICTALPANTGMLLDPSTVAVDTDGQIEVLWSDSVGDDFSKNQLRARCESRYHVSVYQPLGVVKMTTASA
ncbi:phage major capsid protein [Tomitella biformata]|uniref:phage major capsid protein n=1 Tax=Tomitella biformata TaxID=630403 RepID=UPI000463889E|nr:phage major capsid protein [Tomitella biformata]